MYIDFDTHRHALRPQLRPDRPVCESGHLTDQVIKGDDNSLWDTIQKLNLKASTTKAFKLKFNIPAGLAAGYSILLGRIDSGNAVIESNEADNTAVGA